MRNGAGLKEGHIIESKTYFVAFHNAEADDCVGYNFVVGKVFGEEGESAAKFEFLFTGSLEDGGGEGSHKGVARNEHGV